MNQHPLRKYCTPWDPSQKHPTIDLLNAPPVVLRQLEVVGLHPLVKGSHDGKWVVGML